MEAVPPLGAGLWRLNDNLAFADPSRDVDMELACASDGQGDASDGIL